MGNKEDLYRTSASYPGQELSAVGSLVERREGR